METNQYPTPRTDTKYKVRLRLYPQSLCENEVVCVEFARQLEQELQQFKELLAIQTQNAIELQIERGQVKDQLSQWRECAKALNKSLAEQECSCLASYAEKFNTVHKCFRCKALSLYNQLNQEKNEPNRD